MKSSTQTLIAEMRTLSIQIEGGDGAANLAILEAADRLEEFEIALHDAVRRPLGVVPDSADGLYRQDYWDNQDKMKYHDSPFHVTHDKQTADAMCEAFNPKP